MDTALQFKYGWEAVKPTKPKRPAHIIDLDEKIKALWDLKSEIIDHALDSGAKQLPYTELNALDDEIDELEKKRQKALDYWNETGDWDDPIPYTKEML